mgnify:CR=1 FL=1
MQLLRLLRLRLLAPLVVERFAKLNLGNPTTSLTALDMEKQRVAYGMTMLRNAINRTKRASRILLLPLRHLLLEVMRVQQVVEIFAKLNLGNPTTSLTALDMEKQRVACGVTTLRNVINHRTKRASRILLPHHLRHRHQRLRKVTKKKTVMEIKIGRAHV